MTEAAWLTLYCALVLAISLFGGWVPFVGKITHNRLQFYLSLSAGVMLGAAFFHLMPEAIENCGAKAFGWWMSAGAVGLFCIERFIAPHSHEVTGRAAASVPQGEDHHHGDPHDHGEHRAAAPPVAGWMAVLGLTLHTFMNGVGLAGQVHDEIASSAALPGLTIFLAIFLHKPADALAISVVLSRRGTPRRRVALVQAGFALMVPIGAAAFALTAGSVQRELEQQITGAALAFSSGTFLFIALSDLLPEVQFHRHDRIPLFLSLVFGVALMGGIAYLEEAAHGHGSSATPSGHRGDHAHTAPEHADEH